MMPTTYLLAGTAIAALLAGSVAGWTARGVIADRNMAEVQALHAQERQRHADAARKAEADARAVEQARTAKLEAIQNEADKRTAALSRDADAARRSADSLRQHVARLAGSYQAASDSGVASSSEATAGPGLLLTDLFSRTLDRTVELAEYADRARTAGLACEQAYEAVRKP